MSMLQEPWAIGRNTSISFIWAGNRIDLRDVTGFLANQIADVEAVRPLNSYTTRLHIPDGWTGHITIARNGAGMDRLIDSIEKGFWSAARLGLGSVYQYVFEKDGSTQTRFYDGVSMTYNETEWAKNNVIYGTFNFDAQSRTLL